MPARRDHLQALTRLCRQFGGRLSILSSGEFDVLFSRTGEKKTWRERDEVLQEAPFTDAHGLNWQRKIVYAVRGREEVGAIIHEMGHVFADRYPPDDQKCQEWDWFGWEVALARKIGAVRVWSRHNSDYSTREDGSAPWKSLAQKQRRHVIADRLAIARKLGVIDASGAPLSLRCKRKI